MNKRFVAVLAVISILLSGCQEEKNEVTGNNGLKKYKGLSQGTQFKYDMTVPVENIDEIYTLAYDKENIYVAGSNEEKVSGYAFHILDTESGNFSELVPSFEYSYISQCVFSDNFMFFVYSDAEYNRCIAVTDKTGKEISSIQMPDDDDRQIDAVAISKENNLCLISRETNDSGKYDSYLEVYDYSLENITRVSLDEKFSLDENEIAVNVKSDTDGNFYVQFITADENDEIILRNRLLKLSPNLEILFEINDFSDMPGYMPYLLSADHEKMTVISVDQETNTVYHNLYSTADGNIISRDEFYNTESLDFDAVYDHLFYRRENVLCRYNFESQAEEVLFTDEKNENIKYNVMVANDKEVLYMSEKYTPECMMLNVYNNSIKHTESIEIEIDSDSYVKNISDMCVVGDNIYMICDIAHGDAYEPIEMTHDGQTYTMGYVGDYYEENNSIICIVDSTSKEVQWVTPEDMGNSSMLLSEIESGSNGDLLILTQSADGSVSEVLSVAKESLTDIKKREDVSSVSPYGLISSADGDVYLFMYGESIGFQKLGESEFIPLEEKKPVENIDFTYYDGYFMTGYDIENREMEFFSSDVIIEDSITLDDGSLLCITFDYKTFTKQLSLISCADNESRKEVLNICCVDSYDINLKESVSEFNKRQDSFCAVINIYDDETSLQNDISLGAGCDIVISDERYGIDKYTDKTIFEDLMAFIKKDIDINKYMPYVFDADSDGKLYSVAPEFELYTFALSDSYRSAYAGWNTEMMKEFSDGNMGAFYFDKKDFASRLINHNISSFIDMKSGKCDFDNEIFSAIIDTAMTCTMEQTDEKRVHSYILSDIDRYLEDYENQCVVGVPSVDSHRMNIMKFPLSFSVCANSQNKDKAWEFIKYFLSEEYQKNCNSLPVMKSVYDGYIKDEKSKEKIDDLILQLDWTVREPDISTEIEKIIDEQLEYYFNDMTDKKELVENLNSKVGLFMKER